MSKDEKEMIDAFKQLSADGRIDVLSYTRTVSKAERNVKKQYQKPSATTKRRKVAARA